MHVRTSCSINRSCGVPYGAAGVGSRTILISIEMPAGIAVDMGGIPRRIVTSALVLHESTTSGTIIETTESGNALARIVRIPHIARGITRIGCAVASHHQHIATGRWTELSTETNYAEAEAFAAPTCFRAVSGKLTVDQREAFSLHRIGLVNLLTRTEISVATYVGAHIHVAAHISGHTRIDSGSTDIVSQADRLRRANTRFCGSIRLGVVGGDEGGDGDGGHHGHGHRGGGQGAGTRKRATGCRSRSCIVSWCVADTITPLPHLVPYPQSVHPSESLNSRVDILCIMPLSLLFYV